MDFKPVVTLDIECYENYLLVMFKKITTGKVIYFEKFNDSEYNRVNVLQLLNKYTIISFNGIKYDVVILEAANAGLSNKSIFYASKMLIEDNKQPWQVRKQLGIAALSLDHIDLIEVAPLRASLKLYGGRIHSKKMQDLPIEPDQIITQEQRIELIEYCKNDNEVTADILKTLEEAIDLRIAITREYKTDVRSKSDAQIAEAVIKHEMKTKYGITPKRPKIETGTLFYYKPPSNLKFQTELLQELFNDFCNYPFELAGNGHVKLPEVLQKRKFILGKTEYKVGVGGLHSCESKQSYITGKYLYKDFDVAAFYPNIIMNNKLTPKHLGEPFLDIYKSIVDRRLKAKAEGDKVVNESLKITINGSFGKLANKWSFLYAPDLMMQVTVTGQLSLLMLIERLELININVISANTDGIVVEMLPEQQEIVNEIISDWEFETDYEMEENNYKALYSRDVNNYIAITDKKVKSKGAYADPRVVPNILKKNPTNEICVDAVKEFLQNGTDIEDTIYFAQDFTKFITIRTVKGGAIYNGEFIGKAVRWYYSTKSQGTINYKTSGNKVPRTDGCKPAMELPNKIPQDLDFNWYVQECYKILKEIGYKN